MNEAELLFLDVLGTDRFSLYQNRQRILDKDKQSLISAALKRRIRGEPIQYILGKTEFMGLEFKVGPEVLIPRPETEILVETVIKHLSALGLQSSAVRILEIGTGSGCIAIALAKFLPSAKIDALDISEDALNIARENAKNHRVEVNFFSGDIFSACDPGLKGYDFVVSNPPYILSAEINRLQPEISYEPRVALDGGKDGLIFFRQLAAVCPVYLNQKGYLFIEMGMDQLEAIKYIFQNQGDFEIIEVVRDYLNKDRSLVLKRA